MPKKKTVPFGFQLGSKGTVSYNENLGDLLDTLERNWQGSALQKTENEICIGDIKLGHDESTATSLIEIPKRSGNTTIYRINTGKISIDGSNFVYDAEQLEIGAIYRRVKKLYDGITKYLKREVNAIDSLITFLQGNHNQYKLKFDANGFVHVGENFMLREYQSPFPDGTPTYLVRINNLSYYIADDNVDVREIEAPGIIAKRTYTGSIDRLYFNVTLLYDGITRDNIRKYNWQRNVWPRLLWCLIGASFASAVSICCSRSQMFPVHPKHKTEIPPGSIRTDCVTQQNCR